MTEPYIHRQITRTQRQKKTSEMLDRLRENPKDFEALEWLRDCKISYIKLKKENGQSVEVRV